MEISCGEMLLVRWFILLFTAVVCPDIPVIHSPDRVDSQLRMLSPVARNPEIEAVSTESGTCKYRVDLCWGIVRASVRYNFFASSIYKIADTLNSPHSPLPWNTYFLAASSPNILANSHQILIKPHHVWIITQTSPICGVSRPRSASV